MMMFTQQETLFLALPDNFVTGSSIMPQKKNYDLFEIMRANGKVFGSLQMQIQESSGPRFRGASTMVHRLGYGALCTTNGEVLLPHSMEAHFCSLSRCIA
eukprot:g20866.t1